MVGGSIDGVHQQLFAMLMEHLASVEHQYTICVYACNMCMILIIYVYICVCMYIYIYIYNDNVINVVEWCINNTVKCMLPEQLDFVFLHISWRDIWYNHLHVQLVHDWHLHKRKKNRKLNCFPKLHQMAPTVHHWKKKNLLEEITFPIQLCFKLVTI